MEFLKNISEPFRAHRIKLVWTLRIKAWLRSTFALFTSEPKFGFQLKNVFLFVEILLFPGIFMPVTHSSPFFLLSKVKRWRYLELLPLVNGAHLIQCILHSNEHFRETLSRPIAQIVTSFLCLVIITLNTWESTLYRNLKTPS